LLIALCPHYPAHRSKFRGGSGHALFTDTSEPGVGHWGKYNIIWLLTDPGFEPAAYQSTQQNALTGFANCKQFLLREPPAERLGDLQAES
jgi:hypothetical protein